MKNINYLIGATIVGLMRYMNQLIYKAIYNNTKINVLFLHDDIKGGLACLRRALAAYTSTIVQLFVFRTWSQPQPEAGDFPNVFHSKSLSSAKSPCLCFSPPAIE